ncbi:MAG: class I SAM-dependent methyltransferase [Allosphingosinicella sp.]|uniref:class I SAM-dependent methyltransferase n=1 Tax=Allosphingosinicella sp. TaxID=2823234 RepID=UPI00395D1B0B
MTSREATSLLSRTHAAEEWLRDQWGVRDWATLLAFGALNAPWLAKSLYGGSKASKRALLAGLDLPQDALPNLGSWKADTGLLQLVADHILAERPETVVEFGTGASTLIVAKALKLAGGPRTFISIEQHEEFAQKTREWLAEHGLEADLRAVPLRPSPGGWPGLWYDHEPLPDRIDFMLVDGPPWSIHPFTRGAAATLFGRIPVGGVVMLDDAARPGERVVARRWKKMWPNFDFVLDKRGVKGTLIGRRVR